ncbi:hypothetical protein [Haloarcula rubra]|uniref:hypothetical protein n=1 Tax=Haloarcula rubra TaxID=2487747 RepID=UPI001F15FB5D|nr:hypothetical protein [Halomicroarcula rubra]
MRRRTLLALCGSLVAGSGCLDLTPDTAPGDESVTPVPEPTTESGTHDDQIPTVDVASAVVQPGVVAPDSPDSIGVFADAGQYLLVDVAVDGPLPDRSAFECHFDGETHRPTAFTSGLYRNGEWGAGYGDGSDGVLVFELPETGDASDARLTWDHGEWVPPARVRSRLEAPLPSFSVALDGPTTVTAEDDPTVSVRVTNEGDRTGRYALALNRTGPRVAYAPVARIAGELGPGASTTREVDAESPYVADPPREAVYRLDAADDDNDARLTISPAEAGTATRTAEELGESTATDSE